MLLISLMTKTSCAIDDFILLLFAGLLVSVLLELIWYASDELGLLR